MIKSVSRLSSGARVAIVGGGLIGLATAWRLAQRGYAVRLFERETPGAGASFAAAGMLSVVAEAEPAHRPFFELCRESRRRWPSFAAELQSLTRQSVDLVEQGTLLVARTSAEEQQFAALARRHEGDGTLRALAPTDWRRLEPGLSDEARAVYLAPEDGQVDNRAVVAALAHAFMAAGGELVDGVEVRRLIDGSGRVSAVETSTALYETDIVVLATGVGTQALLAASGLDGLVPPVTPVKGEMIAMQMDAAPMVRRVIRGEDAYLVPRSSGRLIIGASSVPGVSDLSLTAATRDELRGAAIRLVPELARLPVVDHWAGVRPHLEGGLPLIGAVMPGLIVALGHYRNGVLLTPITADLVAGVIEGVLTGPEQSFATAFGSDRPKLAQTASL